MTRRNSLARQGGTLAGPNLSGDDMDTTIVPHSDRRVQLRYLDVAAIRRYLAAVYILRHDLARGLRRLEGL